MGTINIGCKVTGLIHTQKAATTQQKSMQRRLGGPVSAAARSIKATKSRPRPGITPSTRNKGALLGLSDRSVDTCSVPSGALKAARPVIFTRTQGSGAKNFQVAKPDTIVNLWLRMLINPMARLVCSGKSGWDAKGRDAK
jgi:hypothetical protein